MGKELILFTADKIDGLSFYLEQPSATNENAQQHEASHGLSAIAELLVCSRVMRPSLAVQAGDTLRRTERPVQCAQKIHENVK